MVATQYPIFGLYVLYHTQAELSRCLFVPANIRSLKGETLSCPHVLWASAGQGTVEVVGGYPPGERAPLPPAERCRTKSPPSGISLH